jgi:hypothetical protein
MEIVAEVAYNVPVMTSNRPGDCVLAIIQQPDVAVSLTCTDSGAWRSMIFEFATKKVVFADEKEKRLADAQQKIVTMLAQLYGFTPEIKWRHSNTTRGDGPNG